MNAERYKQFRKEVDSLNSSPLGKLCEQLLLQAKVEAAPQYLYPLQVALEVLENHFETLGGPAAKERERLISLIYVALEGPPKANLDRLIPRDKLESRSLANENLTKKLQGSKLETVGARLIENLFWNLAEELPESMPLGLTES